MIEVEFLLSYSFENRAKGSSFQFALENVQSLVCAIQRLCNLQCVRFRGCEIPADLLPGREIALFRSYHRCITGKIYSGFSVWDSFERDSSVNAPIFVRSGDYHKGRTFIT